MDADCPPTERDVSVVVITRNRRDSALRCLRELTARSPDAPVIVVDNESSDGTAVALRSAFPQIRVLEPGRNLASAGRTLGARIADTRFVAFADDDSWWAPGALARAAGVLHVHPRVAVLAGRVLVGPATREDCFNEVLANSPLPPVGDLPGPPVLGFMACAAVVRRDAFLDAGGFHPRYGVGGEEGLLAIDLAACGWALAYVDSLVAHHHPSSGGRSRRGPNSVRNALWTAWLRRPVPSVTALTADAVRSGIRDADAARGLLAAVRGLPWVWRERRAIPRDVERQLRLLSD